MVHTTGNCKQCVYLFKLERESYKTIALLKTNPWNGHLPSGLFLAHAKIKQISECLSCADEPAAMDYGMLAVLNAMYYYT